MEITLELTLYENYVYTRKLELNLDEQNRNAHLMYEYIKNTFANKDHNGQDTMVYNLYDKYNYLLYPLNGVNDLYDSISKTFKECLLHKHGSIPYNGNYSIQCWLNFYHKGEFIDWHKHWPEQFNSWHGFYCLDVEPNSSTTYKLPNDVIVDVKSENNLFVIGPSDGDYHRSSEWNLDKPRITIAFDIVPTQLLCETNRAFAVQNHWIPLKLN